jgi:phosphate transport system permease protein
MLVVGSMAIALFIGVSAAIYLNEYSKNGRFVHFVRLAILNLAGVPSIVFGLFGLGLFVVFMPVLQNFHNPAVPSMPVGFGHYLNFSGWNVCLLSGWFTLAFMALPVVITASEESLKAVPMGFREGSLALGATKWQTIRTNVLPYALPGMLTSSILSIARVAGETAPIMFTAAYVVRDKMPWDVQHPLDILFQGVMALPYHIYVVSSKIPQNEYTERVQYGAAFVFLVLVMSIALTSIFLRMRMRSRHQW